MAGRGFNIARLPSGTPNIVSYKYDSAQTFVAGALVVDASDGEIVEFGGGTDAVVLGVALEGANTRPGGTGIAHNPLVVTGGQKDEVSVAVADRSTVFSCRGVDGSTDPVTPTVTHIGEKYGVAKHADGEWYLDIAETTTLICEIVDIDIDNKIFFVKFLEAVLALP
jgi:hypothetical protein